MRVAQHQHHKMQQVPWGEAPTVCKPGEIAQKSNDDDDVISFSSSLKVSHSPHDTPLLLTNT